MKLHIFGSTADDKGAQLENLTKKILERLGYSSVALNVIGSGGNEVDIRASYVVPPLAHSEPVQIVGECKAYQSPLTMPDWLKFVGKVYSEKLRSRAQVRGLLIALGGVNGNVRGAFDQLREDSSDIEIVTAEHLHAHLVVLFDMAPLADVSEFVRAAVPVPAVEVSAGYYDGMAFWVIQFSDGTCTLLAGRQLSAPIPVRTAKVVVAHLGVKELRDPRAEAQAKQRAAAAEQCVLTQLLLSSPLDRRALLGSPLSASIAPAIGVKEIEAAIVKLQSSGLVVSAEEGVHALGDVRSNMDLRTRLFLCLTEGACLVEPWGRPPLAELIDEELLDRALELQGGLELQKTDRANALAVLRHSLSALAWAIRPDGMLTAHRPNSGPQKASLDANDARYFMARVLEKLHRDFEQPALSTVFFDRLGIREMELRRTIVLKSKRAAEHTFEVAERLSIAQTTEEYGGGLVRVWMFASAPEPWETSPGDSELRPSDSADDRNGTRGGESSADNEPKQD